jgi:hypothetical protein
MISNRLDLATMRLELAKCVPDLVRLELQHKFSCIVFMLHVCFKVIKKLYHSCLQSTIMMLQELYFSRMLRKCF